MRNRSAPDNDRYRPCLGVAGLRSPPLRPDPVGPENDGWQGGAFSTRLVAPSAHHLKFRVGAPLERSLRDKPSNGTSVAPGPPQARGALWGSPAAPLRRLPRGRRRPPTRRSATPRPLCKRRALLCGCMRRTMVAASRDVRNAAHSIGVRGDPCTALTEDAAAAIDVELSVP